MRISKDKSLNRGSALLIVLGFLTFVTISAVAFAIYMRVERQATSNYRHSIESRHLLETALFRAMDEIDGELRVAGESRFPDWPGRVRISPAILDGNTAENDYANEQEARLLSFEALSFLPASIVNGVRANAVFAPNIPNSPTDEEKMAGAKWRPLSMPIQNNISAETGIATNSIGKSIVGRYAYLCVNLSDMLDVNNSAVSARSIENYVSIAHLFENASKFNTQRSNDVSYATLQDFYNCMGVREQSEYFASGMSDSPYLSFLRNNNGNEAFSQADYHVLTTDALAKSEPHRTTAFNLKNSPLQNMSFPYINLTDDFRNALKLAFPEGGTRNAVEGGSHYMFEDLLQGSQAAGQGAFATMLADYITGGNAHQTRLDVPSCKLAPMISGIAILPQRSLLAPKMYTKEDKASGDPVTKEEIFAQLIGGFLPGDGDAAVSTAIDNLKATSSIQVQICWPFRNVSAERYGSFTVEVEGWLHVEKTHAELNAGSTSLQKFPPIKFTGESQNVQLQSLGPNSTPDECFQNVGITLRFDTPTPAQFTHKIGSRPIGGGDPSMEANWHKDGFSTAIIVFVRIKNDRGIFVDSVPQYYPLPLRQNSGLPELTEFENTPKLFFQTKTEPVLSANNTGIPLEFEWSGLEVPDPRFNYRPSNWIISEGFGITKSRNWFLGEDGRDSDIFMSVAGVGENTLRSPGELGFIIRPFFLERNRGRTIDFRAARLLIGKDKFDLNNDDSASFFRTVRLYDHGGEDPHKEKHDPVYEHFYAASDDDDGTFLGSSRTRVNPLSKNDIILEAAIDRVPYDYWFAVTNATKTSTTPDYINKDWPEKFVETWVNAITNLVAEKEVGRRINDYTSIRSIYPELRKIGTTITDRKGWRGPPSTPGQLSSFIFDVDVGTPLSEVDRKMLYAFSLDSFSDRQQLFLYIVQAEATSSTSADVRSLAGGKAIALVWRDPYPRGSEIAVTGNLNYTFGDYDKFARMFENDYPYRLGQSPWWKVKNPSATTAGIPSRTRGYHEHQVLFFKQLNN